MSAEPPAPEASGRPEPTDDFLVAYDRQRVGVANERAARVLMVSATVTTLVALVVVGLAVLMVSSSAGLVTGTIVVALALLAAGLAVRSWRAVVAFRRTAVRMHSVRDALRVTDEGVEFPDPERGGTVVLPWHAIGEARIVLLRGEQVLVLELDRGFRPDDPAARGLDDPAAWKALQRGAGGMPGPRFAMRHLQTSGPEIDAALREHSGGRVSLS